MKGKVFYIISWSAVLFLATFPMVVRGEFSFDFRASKVSEVSDRYIFPLIMAMALFLSDAIYAYLQAHHMSQTKELIYLLTWVAVFMVAFALSLFGSSGLSLTMFVIAWIAMTMMKMVTTPTIKSAPHLRSGIIINED